MAMEATKECDPRIAATKTVFQTNFDNLRRELKHNIGDLNSKLRSKGLITEEVWSKFDIDETLSAISGRLKNEDVTVRTFTEFSDAISEISSHLKTMLSKALSKELKEEHVLSFQIPSYALHAISEHYQTTPTGSFVSSLISNIPGPTVPSSTSSCPGTSKERAWADVTTRGDSALFTNSATDGEELPRELLPVPRSHQVTDHDDLMVHMDTASGTLPTLESNLRARVLALEKEVSELQETNEQLYRDKRENLKLVCDKTRDTITANTQLKKACESLQLEEDKTRRKHDALKKERLDIEQALDQLTSKHLEQTKKFEEQLKHEKENTRLAEEIADKRARLAEEEADKRARLAEEEADKRARLAVEEAAIQARLAKEEVGERARLAEKEADERARLAEEVADERIRLKTEEEKDKTRKAEDRARHAEEQIKRYQQDEALRFAELQRFVEEHLRITNEKLNRLNI